MVVEAEIDIVSNAIVVAELLSEAGINRAKVENVPMAKYRQDGPAFILTARKRVSISGMINPCTRIADNREAK